MKMLFVLIVSLVIVSCDNFTISKPKKDDPEIVELPNDADFISFAGERYEKYYFQLDPAIWDRTHTLSVSVRSPNVRDANNYNTNNYLYNTITITNFPLRGFFVPGSYYLSGYGNFAYNTTLGIYQNIAGYLFPFNAIVIIAVDETSSNYAATHEEYTVNTVFSNQSLSLPKTAPYSNPYYLYKYKTYYFTLSADQFFQYFNAHSRPSDYHSNTVSSAMPMSLTTFDPHLLKSRDFYQYKSFIITYKPGLVIHGFNLKPMPHPVVETITFDEEENAISVSFRHYNEPYTGPLFTYWIEAEDGTWRDKTVSIE